jgi:hypothetical protein
MFALLFASQTIAAAFDFHSAHQENDSQQSLSHRTIDESHKSHQEGTLAVTGTDVDSAEQSQFDCHHCCHCHAPSGVYITCNDESSLLYKGNDNVFFGKTALFSLWISPEHRPPIV